MQLGKTIACHSICYEKHCAVKAEIIAFPHEIMTHTHIENTTKTKRKMC